MKVFTWASSDPDLKPTQRAVARIQHDGEWMLPIFYGPSEDEVRAQAETWWEAELARYTSATEGRQKRAQALRKKPASDDVGIIL